MYIHKAYKIMSASNYKINNINIIVHINIFRALTYKYWDDGYVCVYTHRDGTYIWIYFLRLSMTDNINSPWQEIETPSCSSPCLLKLHSKLLLWCRLCRRNHPLRPSFLFYFFRCIYNFQCPYNISALCYWYFFCPFLPFLLCEVTFVTQGSWL